MKKILCCICMTLIAASCSSDNTTVKVVGNLLNKPTLAIGIGVKELEKISGKLLADDFILTTTHAENVKNKNHEFKVEYDFDGLLFPSLDEILILCDDQVDSLYKSSILSMCVDELCNYKELHRKPYKSIDTNVPYYYWYNDTIHYFLEIHKNNDIDSLKNNPYWFSLTISKKLPFDPTIYKEGNEIGVK